MAKIYQQLCPVLFGAGAAKEVGEKAKEFGAGKVLVIYDAGVKAAGLTDGVIESLNAAGLDYKIFDGILPDAPDDTVNAAGQLAQEYAPNVIIGLGGGSAMDSAKSIAVLAENPLPISQHFTTNGGGMFFGKNVKLILIPTNSGTGSEVTPISVVHDMTRNVKDTILRPADLAILDPELTLTAPAKVTAASGMDAMSHAVEAYTSNGANPKSDLLALEAVRLIAENLEKSCANGSDIDARSALSFASNIAGISFADASVHIGHCAAHELGVQFEYAHGVVCAIAAPCVVEFAASAMPVDKMKKLAEALHVEVPEGADSEAIGNLCGAAMRELSRKVNIPSLKELGATREKAVACADGAVNNNWFYIMAPKEVNVEVMAEFIGNMYDKY